MSLLKAIQVYSTDDRRPSVESQISEILNSLKTSTNIPFVPRVSIPEVTRGLYSSRYLANLDCCGQGPKGRFKIGRKVVYPVQKLIDWLALRSSGV